MRQQVNFYSGKIRSSSRIQPLYVITTITAATFIFTLVWGSLWSAKLKSKNNELTTLTSELNSLQQALAAKDKDSIPIPLDNSLQGAVEMLEKKLKLRESLLQTVNALLSPRSAKLSPLFVALAKHHREGLWLSSVHVNRAKGILSVHGNTVDPALVAGYLNRIGRDPVISQSGFDFLRLATPEQDDDPKKANKSPEFVITTDEDEFRELIGATVTSTPPSPNADLFSESYRLLEQLKKLAHE